MNNTVEKISREKRVMMNGIQGETANSKGHFRGSMKTQYTGGFLNCKYT